MVPKISLAAHHHEVGLAKEVSRKWAQVVRPIIPRQIILVPRIVCWEVGLSYQGNSCSCRGRSVGRWLCATKAKHVCFADKLLEIGFVAPHQFVPRTECLKLALRTKPSQVAENRMLDDGFVAKASSLKPRPSLLYLEAQMNGRYVS